MDPIESSGIDDGLRRVCRSDRFHPYQRAHQRLRAAVGDVLRQCARLDASSAADCARVARDIDQLLALYAAHQSAEDMTLHAALRDRAPRALLAFDAEHEDQLAHIAALRALLGELNAAPAQVVPVIHELELRLSQFIADGLAHLADEETTLTRVLWLHFNDAELRALANTRDAAAHDTATHGATDSPATHSLANKEMT